MSIKISLLLLRIIILLKIISFTKGNSGVSLDLVNQLLIFLNHNCLPLIPSQGSVGASGDLAPLSHMTLALMGIGEVKYANKVILAKEALKKINNLILSLLSNSLLTGLKNMEHTKVILFIIKKKIRGV